MTQEPTLATALEIAIESTRGTGPQQDRAAARLERLVPFVEAAMAYCEPRKAKNYGGTKWRMMDAYRALSPEETTKP